MTNEDKVTALAKVIYDALIASDPKAYMGEMRPECDAAEEPEDDLRQYNNGTIVDGHFNLHDVARAVIEALKTLD